MIVKHVNTPAFSGDLAVVSFQTCNNTTDRLNPAVFRGFAYDVTDPANPTELARYATEPGLNRGSHEICSSRGRNRAYVYTAVINSGGPHRRCKGRLPHRRRLQPERGRYRAMGRSGQSRPGTEPSRMFTPGDHECAGNARLLLLGPRDGHPRHLRPGASSVPGADERTGEPLGRGGSQRNLLVETHEIAPEVPTLYDISDPASPVKLSDFVIDGFENDTVHDPRLQGQIAAFSWYSFGVQIADISRPAAPTLLASFVPEHDIVNPDFFCTTPCSEVWGAYIHRDYILASDMNSGLWVFRVK